MNVLDAARDRIAWTFDNIPHVYVSFSAGKDSTVMLHLVMDEAIKRNRKVGVMFVDLEAQYKLTIDHAEKCFTMYAEHIHPFWVALPIHLRNAVSQYEPHWICWEPDAKSEWVRNPPAMAITNQDHFPFYHYGMEFEEFVPQFGNWYGKGELTACFVGIRSDESLNRYRTMKMKKQCIDGKQWTTYVRDSTYNVYPMYDWRTADIWRYHGKYGTPHNRLYDLMHKAGLSIHQQRICQPYGDDQRKGLWLFHLIEPETWSRVVARVNGANSGALYSRETGNITGTIKVTKPDGHSWKSFAELLLASMPGPTQDHYKDKITMFLHWYEDRGYPDGIPDEGPANDKGSPSWTRVCKALLRNDYGCKGLSFTQTKSASYENYKRIMKRRRSAWGLI